MRKGFSAQAFVYIMICLVALVILLGINTNLQAKTGKLIPTDNGSANQHGSAELQVPPETNTIFTTLEKALTEGQASKDSQCIITHPDFPDFKDSNVVLGKTQDGLYLQVIDQYGRTVKQTTIPGLAPCLVAGQGGLNFFDDHFGAKLGKRPEFMESPVLTLIGKDTLTNGTANFDLEDNNCCGNNKINVLYKADAGHVCFIPTRNGGFSCAVNSDGILDDDCISNTESGILAKIRPCSLR